MGEPSGEPPKQLNVLGLPIELCCMDPVTGFFRDGHCHTGPYDHGRHTVCALMTEEFLTYSVAAGNDLVTPMPQYEFPGYNLAIDGACVQCDGSKHTRLGRHPVCTCALPTRKHLRLCRWQYSSNLP